MSIFRHWVTLTLGRKKSESLKKGDSGFDWSPRDQRLFPHLVQCTIGSLNKSLNFLFAHSKIFGKDREGKYLKQNKRAKSSASK